MKVAASPQVYMRRCPKVVFKSLIPSHSSLLSNFRVQGCCGGFAASIIGDARLPFSSLFPSKKPQSESNDSLCGFFDADKI